MQISPCASSRGQNPAYRRQAFWHGFKAKKRLALLGTVETMSLQFNAWLRELPLDYCDRDFILQGVQSGFHIVNSELIANYVRQKNHYSAVDPQIAARIEQAILLKVSHGRYKVADTMPNITSPLGAIVKPSGDICLIHDCSCPTGRSLNDYAAYDSIHFQSLDDARQFITPSC